MSDPPRRGERWWCELPDLGVLVGRLGRLGDERMREDCGALAVAVA